MDRGTWLLGSKPLGSNAPTEQSASQPPGPSGGPQYHDGLTHNRRPAGAYFHRKRCLGNPAAPERPGLCETVSILSGSGARLQETGTSLFLARINVLIHYLCHLMIYPRGTQGWESHQLEVTVSLFQIQLWFPNLSPLILLCRALWPASPNLQSQPCHSAF